MSAWARVANLGKVKNLKGGLLAYPCESLPFLLEEGMEVAFVPPVLRVPRTGRITHIQEQAGERILCPSIRFSRSTRQNSLLVTVCLVRKADLRRL